MNKKKYTPILVTTTDLERSLKAEKGPDPCVTIEEVARLAEAIATIPSPPGYDGRALSDPDVLDQLAKLQRNLVERAQIVIFGWLADFSGEDYRDVRRRAIKQAGFEAHYGIEHGGSNMVGYLDKAGRRLLAIELAM